MSKLVQGARGLILLGIAGALSLAAVGCKEVTEKVVEKGVQAAKDTSKGVSDGLDAGRKSGESSDDALIVSSPQDLVGKGTIVVHAVHPAASDAKVAEVDLALENTGERPLRITKLEVIALDKEGFVKRPSTDPTEMTVPPKAKEKLTLSFPVEAKTLAKVRIWDKDQDVVLSN